MAADRHAATIEELLVAVASADRHEDSPERKVAWDEIKRREAERVMLKALLGGGRAPTDEEVAYFRRLMDSTDRSDAAQPNETVEIAAPDGHETGGVVQVTFWRDGNVSIGIRDALGRLKLTGLELIGPEMNLIVERDW